MCTGNLCTDVSARAYEELRLCFQIHAVSCTSFFSRPGALPCPDLTPPPPPTSHCLLQAMQDLLRSVCADLTVTQGDFDESTKWPDTAVVNVGDFRIGVCHGHQSVPWGDRDALAVLQRRLDVDILVTGHTHTFGAYRHDGCIVINPGSATGAYSLTAGDPAPNPSFALMDVDGRRATVYLYELEQGEIKVEKIEFSKEAAA